MAANDKKANRKSKGLEQALQQAADKQNTSAQKDGFRYDYTDSSDFNNDKME